MARSKYQAYETETISRSEIKNAPYNPRVMDDTARKKLKAGIKKHGLVSALTWNKRTGNLVGGHQRLKQLDALEKSQDYDLTVCVVDVDEREEAELNVQLNNPSMQGTFDFESLAAMSEEFDLDMETDLAFSKTDIDFMFDGDERFSELFDSPERENIKDTIEDIKAQKKASREKLQEKECVDYYVTVVFGSAEEKQNFLKEINVPKYETFITEDQVKRLMK